MAGHSPSPQTAALCVADLASLEGRSFAASDWILMDQPRIDAFADCTGDRQFIHVDPERARAQTPFGGTIAHGFLTLSLIAAHPPPDFPAITDLALVINYGLDRVRFLAPVPAGARVRLLSRVLDVTVKAPGRMLVTQEKTLELEGSTTPAYVAVQLTMFVAAQP